MHSNAVNTQGKAGPLRVGHGAGLMPEPLTFSHKSLQSELPLNVVGRSGVWCCLWRGQSCPVHPYYCSKTLQTLDLFSGLLWFHLILKAQELVPE